MLPLLAGDDKGRKPAAAKLLPAATATISVSPVSILKGQSATLTWTTKNASAVKLQGTTVATSGSQTVSPNQSTDFVLTAQGDSETAVATVKARLTVLSPTWPPHAPTAPITVKPQGIQRGHAATLATISPTATISITPDSIQRGQSATLTWATENALDVTLQGAKVDPSGSQTVSPTQSTDYLLTAQGAPVTKTATAKARVTVTEPPPKK